MNDEEKDLYIKAKIKDGHIPERIDNLFNNSIKIIENKGEEKMEEKKDQNTEENSEINNDNKKQAEKKKMPVAAKRILATAACLTVLIGGGNIYASTQGYDNIFFLIMDKLGISTDAFGKDNILSDRDITISYKPIEIARGTQLQVNSLVIKDNEAKLKVQVKETGLDEKITPLTYVVKDENGTELYTSVLDKSKILSGDVNTDGVVDGRDLIRLKKYLSGETELNKEQKANADVNQDGTVNEDDTTILTKHLAEAEGYETLPYNSDTSKAYLQYKEELKLDGFKEDTKKLTLEIYKSNSDKIVDIEIDLEKKQMSVIGNAEEVRKISEEELKNYLGAFAMLNCDESKYNKNLTENEKKTITALLIAENKATSVDVGLYQKSKTVLDKEKIHAFIKSFTDLKLNENGVMDFKDGDIFNTITYKGNTQYIYEKDEVGFNPTCLEVTDISYVNGIYNVTFRFCYSTTENKGFGETSVEDLPVYEMTMGLILDENNEYSKYRVSTMSEVTRIGKNNGEEVDEGNEQKVNFEQYIGRIFQVSDRKADEMEEIEILSVMNDKIVFNYYDNKGTYKNIEAKINGNTATFTIKDSKYKEVRGNLSFINNGDTIKLFIEKEGTEKTETIERTFTQNFKYEDFVGGVWQFEKDAGGMWNEIQIQEIKDRKITFVLARYREEATEKQVVEFKEDTASVAPFSIVDTSKNIKINGLIELEAGRLTVTINNSNVSGWNNNTKNTTATKIEYKNYLGVWAYDGADGEKFQIIVSDINNEQITCELLSYCNISFGKQTSNFGWDTKSMAYFDFKEGTVRTDIALRLEDIGLSLYTQSAEGCGLKPSTDYKLEKINYETYKRTWEDESGKIKIEVLDVNQTQIQYKLNLEGKDYGILYGKFGYDSVLHSSNHIKDAFTDLYINLKKDGINVYISASEKCTLDGYYDLKAQ